MVRVRKQNDRFGRAQGTSLLGNVIPVLAVEDDHGLQLSPYTGLGESFYSLGARWDATLRLPERLRAATTGADVSERVANGVRTVVAATPQARDFALAVGPLKVRTTRVRGIRIRAFAKDARVTRGALRFARRAVAKFSSRFGPYGSTELDVVVVRMRYSGMEYPELVFTEPFGVATTHEVAHQWWYGIVGDDQYREPWLDESFATYSHEWLHPSANFCDPDRPYSLVERPHRQIALDSSMAVFDRAPPFAIGEVIYSAGSCALQRLERDIGRTRMTAFLRLLQSRFRFGVMRTTDVLDAIHAAAPAYRVRRWARLAHLSVR